MKRMWAKEQISGGGSTPENVEIVFDENYVQNANYTAKRIENIVFVTITFKSKVQLSNNTIIGAIAENKNVPDRELRFFGIDGTSLQYKPLGLSADGDFFITAGTMASGDVYETSFSYVLND